MNLLLNHQAKLRRNRGPRGFSLLELAVISTVGSILFLLLIRWILGLGNIATDAVYSAAPATSAAYASSIMQTDLASARPCVNGTSGAIVELLPTSVTFFATTQRPDGSAELTGFTSQNAMSLITWQVDPSGTLIRRAQPVNPIDCTAQGGSAGNVDTVIASPVYSGASADGSSLPKFIPLIAGEAVPGECTRQIDAGGSIFGSGQACSAQALKVLLTFLTPGADPVDPGQWGPGVSPVLVERSWPVGTSGQGVR